MTAPTMTNQRRPAAPSLLRRMNAALVLDVIRADGPITRADIARATRLSKPTVNEVVRGLAERGYVVENAPVDGDHARRPGPRGRLLSFRADLGHVLGLDIGADKVLVAVSDLAGHVVATERRRTAHGQAPDIALVLDQARAVAADACRAAGVTRSDIKAVGVGTPGVVDSSSGAVTLAPQISGWNGVPLAAQLQSSFACPVLVENEVHLAMLAERWSGAACETSDAFLIHVGVGIGGAVLIDGRLYRGASGAAGEIGYLPLDDGADEDPDRQLGPFERTAGGHGFARLGQAAARAPGGELLRELAGGDPDGVDAEIVFLAAARHNAAAARIVAQGVGRLARGIATVVLVMNPEVVILGGGISRAGEALRADVERRLRAFVPVMPRVVLSEFGDNAVTLGAVRLALQAVDADLFAFQAESAA